jgi:toxin HigB-1
MIESFRSKALKEFFETGRSAAVPADLRKRVAVRLDALDSAATLQDLNRPGFRLHPLKPTTRRRRRVG